MKSKLRIAVALGASALALTTLSGCSILDENICGSGEYPVASIGSTGSDCQADGTEPDEGYVRYPEGKVPEKVEDKWDLYWQEHVLDAEGNESPAPAEQ